MAVAVIGIHRLMMPAKEGKRGQMMILHRAIVTHVCDALIHFGADDCFCSFETKDFAKQADAFAFAGDEGDVFEVDGVLTLWGTRPAIPRTKDGKISYRKPRILRKGETVSLTALAAQ